MDEHINTFNAAHDALCGRFGEPEIDDFMAGVAVSIWGDGMNRRTLCVEAGAVGCDLYAQCGDENALWLLSGVVPPGEPDATVMPFSEALDAAIAWLSARGVAIAEAP